jgi:hypothetical protein
MPDVRPDQGHAEGVNLLEEGFEAVMFGDP